MRKTILSTVALLVLLSMSNYASAHTVTTTGGESVGWQYVGNHWQTKWTYYFEATDDRWDNQFTLGINKFETETNLNFEVDKVAVGNSDNFIEAVSCSACGWVARRTFFDIWDEHPDRWRIQYNSAKSSDSWTTVTAHEIGHVFGLDDLYEPRNISKLMYGIDTGLRYVQDTDKVGFRYVYPLQVASATIKDEQSFIENNNNASSDDLAREKVKKLNQRVISGEDKIIEQSAMFPKVSPNEAFLTADIVVKGKVDSIDREYMVNTDIPFTDFKFNVDHYWKSDLSKDVLKTINQLIITQDGNSQSEFNHFPPMKTGEEYILFLKRVLDNNNQEKLVLVGGPNGKLLLNKGIIKEKIDINNVNGKTVEGLIREVSKGSVIKPINE